MACLDTSFLVDILRGRPEAVKILEELDRSKEMLSIAAPSVMELWLGAMLAKVPAAEKAKVGELVESLDILPFDLNSAKEAAEIEAGLILKGLSIGAEDIMIAAIVRVNGEKLVTKDEHYARIPSLTVLKY